MAVAWVVASRVASRCAGQGHALSWSCLPASSKAGWSKYINLHYLVLQAATTGGNFARLNRT